MATLYEADAREIPLPGASVHMCVTSPPYWGLRDYGLGNWQGGDAECEHGRQDSLADAVFAEAHKGSPGGWRQNKGHEAITSCAKCGATQQAAGIGLEPTLGEWVANIVAVGQEVWRVLRDDGTFWCNIGDAYSANRSYQDNKHIGVGNTGGMNAEAVGLAPKNLMGQPWRVAFALQDDGWVLRSAIVWHKPNPMPESVTDRPTSAYEMVFLLSKGPRYYYDAEVGREPSGRAGEIAGGKSDYAFGQFGVRPHKMNGTVPSTANARNVWSIPTQGRPDAHFATFPDELPRRCILAGTSEHGVCAACGAPWVRQVEVRQEHIANQHVNRDASVNFDADMPKTRKHVATLGWQPACGCNAAVVPATVLDPFVGSGTTLAVAQALGRKGVGLDLNPVYLEIAKKRIGGVTLPLLPRGSMF